jgi:hypothetical protein
VTTFGTDSNYNVPINFRFTYGGEVVDWGTTKLLRINDLSNTADPIDGKLKISDLTCTFSDVGEQIWGSMGNGTGAFNKDFVCEAYVGGSMGYESNGVSIDFNNVSTVGANVYTVHTGKVRNVARNGRSVKIHSQNMMNLLGHLEFQPPNRLAPIIIDTWGGTSYSNGGTPVGAEDENGTAKLHPDWSDISNITTAELIGSSGYNEDDGTYEFMAFTSPDLLTLTNFLGTGIYDTDPADGIKDFLSNGYLFCDMNLHQGQAKQKFKVSPNGTMVWPSGTAETGIKFLYPFQPIQLQGDPVAVLRHLLFGKMVSDYYDETTNKEVNTFGTAQKVTAFQVFDQTISVENEKVQPEIEDLLTTTMSLFYVTSQNQFAYEPYGPKYLNEALTEIGSVDIIESSYTNDIEDSYNRFQFNYNWDEKTNEFKDVVVGTYSDWAAVDDRPLIMDSKWILSGNHAQISLNRQMSRFKNTSPKISITTPMKYAGMDLGALVSVTDDDMVLDGQIIQLIDYTKGFGNSNTITFKGLDGTALWSQKGWARWEDGTSAGGTDIIVSAVSGTSTSGWGASGTVNNIDTTLYGTQFVWW